VLLQSCARGLNLRDELVPRQQFQIHATKAPNSPFNVDYYLMLFLANAQTMLTAAIRSAPGAKGPSSAFTEKDHGLHSRLHESSQLRTGLTAHFAMCPVPPLPGQARSLPAASTCIRALHLDGFQAQMHQPSWGHKSCALAFPPDFEHWRSAWALLMYCCHTVQYSSMCKG
jgi:hypothetical protein